MIHLYVGDRIEAEYEDKIIYDADTYFLWDGVKEFSSVELDAINVIDGATYLGNGQFKPKIFGAQLHNASNLSMGCRMLLNLIRNTKKDGKYIYDFTNAGPNVIAYLFSMPEYGKNGEDRYIFVNYMGIETIPADGIYFNDDKHLYTSFEELEPEFMEALHDGYHSL